MIAQSYSDMLLAVQALQADVYEEYNNAPSNQYPPGDGGCNG